MRRAGLKVKIRRSATKPLKAAGTQSNAGLPSPRERTLLESTVSSAPCADESLRLLEFEAERRQRIFNHLLFADGDQRHSGSGKVFSSRVFDFGGRDVFDLFAGFPELLGRKSVLPESCQREHDRAARLRLKGERADGV